MIVSDPTTDAGQFCLGTLISQGDIDAFAQAHGPHWLQHALGLRGLRLAEVSAGASTFRLTRILGERARRPWARIAGGST